MKMDKNIIPFRFSDIESHQESRNTLYILFGQGLGDLIYGNRVLHLLCEKLRFWEIVVFLSKEWKDLSILDEKCVTVIWYPNIQEFGDRFKWGYEYIRKNAKKNGTEYFIHWDSQALPDRYSRHESVFESTCREINLTLSENDLRGYIPKSKITEEIFQNFLKEYSLTEKKYYVLGPHTGEHKNWGIKNYEELGQILYDELGYKCVIVGVSTERIPHISESVPVLSYSLDMVAQIISHSAFFVGNDSGITHLAGCVDVPVYEVFAKARLEPLIEWRTLGPFVRHIIEPYLDSSNLISPITIFNLIKRDHSIFATNKTIRFEICPACLRKMSYVVGCDERSVTYMCKCGGIIYLEDLKKPQEIVNSNESLEEGVMFMPSIPESIQSFKSILSKNSFQEIEVCLVLSNPYKPIDYFKKEPKSNPIFFWSIDSLLLFFKDLGFNPVKMRQVKKQNLYKVKFSKNKKSYFILIPWGGGKGWFINSDVYFRNFCWMPFANYFRASKIPKNVLDYESDRRNTIFASLFVFTSFFGIKSLGILIKNIFRSLFKT